MGEQKTTIQVYTDTWAALDKRKGSDETFDQYIRRLINNTAMPIGTLEDVGEAPTVETGDVERVDDVPVDKSCSEYDSIDGMCANDDLVVRQEWRFPNEDEWSYWYYCEEHAPEVDGDE